jgi:hypothetical protein
MDWRCGSCGRASGLQSAIPWVQTPVPSKKKKKKDNNFEPGIVAHTYNFSTYSGGWGQRISSLRPTCLGHIERFCLKKPYMYGYTSFIYSLYNKTLRVLWKKLNHVYIFVLMYNIQYEWIIHMNIKCEHAFVHII